MSGPTFQVGPLFVRDTLARMTRFASALVLFVALVWVGSAVAQSPGQAGEFPVMRQLAATSGTGLSNGPLIDRTEIRIIRLDIEPGGARLLHTHDDVKYHLVVPITGALQVDLGTPEAVSLVPWQPHFMTAGTRHGYKNAGRAKVSAMEIFVRP